MVWNGSSHCEFYGRKSALERRPDAKVSSIKVWKASPLNLTWARIRSAAANHTTPAAPSTFLERLVVAIAKIRRKATYLQFTPPRARYWVQVPPLGTILLLLLYLGFILALEFINNDVVGAQYWTSLGIRAGWLAIAQMPLLILLAGKNNLIGLVTGLSYERLNILHRWVSRTMLLMVLMHFGYQNYAWNKFGVRSMEWSTDSCVPTGFAAFGLLLWMNLSTLAPFRNFSYEFFVIQHLLTFFGFIIAIMYHLPTTALETRTYIWIPIGLYLFDRLVRTVRSVWNNSSGSRATVVSCGGEVTKIRVRGSRLRKWRPGSFVLLSIPQYGVIQSHPASIVSTPGSHDGDLVFLLRAHKGFTKNLLSAASNVSKTSLSSSFDNEKPKVPEESHRAFIDGPYGGTQGDFGAFDTALLVAGSTGITFVLSILLDLSVRLGNQKLPLRRLELVWAVKKQVHATWLSDELQVALTRLEAAGIETSFRVFVTCDDRITDSVHGSTRPGCQCELSDGQSCCCADHEHTPGRDNALQAHRNELSIPCTSIESDRPNVDVLVSDLLAQAQGEIGVAVCGPLDLSTGVRRTVAKSIKAGMHGIYLHVEGFSW